MDSKIGTLIGDAGITTTDLITHDQMAARGWLSLTQGGFHLADLDICIPVDPGCPVWASEHSILSLHYEI